MSTKKPLERVFEILGGRVKTAKALNIRSWSVYKWNIDKPPRSRCLKLAELTDNEVTAEELRPDINWEYVRQQIESLEKG